MFPISSTSHDSIVIINARARPPMFKLLWQKAFKRNALLDKKCNWCTSPFVACECTTISDRIIRFQASRCEHHTWVSCDQTLKDVEPTAKRFCTKCFYVCMQRTVQRLGDKNERKGWDTRIVEFTKSDGPVINTLPIPLAETINDPYPEFESLSWTPHVETPGYMTWMTPLGYSLTRRTDSDIKHQTYTSEFWTQHSCTSARGHELLVKPIRCGETKHFVRCIRCNTIDHTLIDDPCETKRESTDTATKQSDKPDDLIARKKKLDDTIRTNNRIGMFMSVAIGVLFILLIYCGHVHNVRVASVWDPPRFDPIKELLPNVTQLRHEYECGRVRVTDPSNTNCTTLSLHDVRRQHQFNRDRRLVAKMYALSFHRYSPVVSYNKVVPCLAMANKLFRSMSVYIADNSEWCHVPSSEPWRFNPLARGREYNVVMTPQQVDFILASPRPMEVYNQFVWAMFCDDNTFYELENEFFQRKCYSMSFEYAWKNRILQK